MIIMKWPIKKVAGWIFKVLASVIILGGAGGFLLFKLRPDLFERSHDHQHCMPQIGLALKQYAIDHENKFPYHSKSYGDALLLLADTYLPVGNGDLYTGHGCDGTVFVEAFRKKTHVPEEQCGRVYVQGLTENSDSDLALLFDKLPSARTREVFFVGGHVKWIPNKQWKDFAAKQIDLLVRNGIPHETATSLYRETLRDQ